jgi:hypothetical protein
MDARKRAYDPAIHLLRKASCEELMDPRVTWDVADDHLDEKTSIALEDRYPVVI